MCVVQQPFYIMPSVPPRCASLGASFQPEMHSEADIHHFQFDCVTRCVKIVSVTDKMGH